MNKTQISILGFMVLLAVLAIWFAKFEKLKSVEPSDDIPQVQQITNPTDLESKG